jgi:putative phage-type endonuclease
MERFLNVLCQNEQESGMLFKMMTKPRKQLSKSNPEEVEKLSPAVQNLLENSTEVCFHFRHCNLVGSKIVSRKVESTISSQLKNFYESEVKVTEIQRVNLCKKTVLQASNLLWKTERKKRISASRAHQIVKAKSQAKVLDYFFEEKKDNRNFIYGREMEPKAKTFLKSLLDVEIFDSGLVVKTGQPWLCASPDGFVLNKTGEIVALEIKCPSSCIAKDINVPYIVNDKLKENHPYYTQIQIQLYCCDLDKCLLFVYSSADYKIVEVTKNNYFL